MRKLLIISCLLLIAAGLGWWLTRESPYPITNERPTGTNIIALGDSLTSGHGIGEERSYPAQLARLLNVPILNKGVAGDTAAEALNRLDRDVLANDPRVVLVFLGGNDVLQRHPREQWFPTLEKIVRRVQERGALVILIGMEAGLDGGLNDAYRELARKTGCPFVSRVMSGIIGQSDLLIDAVHPNEKGCALIAQRVATVMRKYVDEPMGR